MSKLVTTEEIVLGISSLYVNDQQAGGWTAGLDTIQTAALLDIAKSLRQLVALARCPNVAQGYRAMERIRRVLERQERKKAEKKKPRAKKRKTRIPRSFWNG